MIYHNHRTLTYYGGIVMNKLKKEENIYSIRQRCSNLRTFINAVFNIGAILGVVWLLCTIALIFLPASGFDNIMHNIKNEKLNWLYGISFLSVHGLPISIEKVLYPKSLSLITNFIALIKYGFLMLIIYYIKNILNSIQYNHTPFILDNADRLKYIGIITIIKSILPNIIAFYSINMAVKYGDTNFFRGFSFIFVGMLILIFAHIFRYGCQLQKDIDETL